MTKESDVDSIDTSGAGGGPKKFLYTPKQKGGFKDATNNPSAVSFGNMTPDSSASVNDMWKHITVQSSASKPSYQDGWTKSVDKGFYSRHGGLNNGATSSSSGRTWTGASSSYSQGGSMGGGRGSIDPLGNLPDQAASTNSLQHGSMGHGSRYFNTTTNNNRKF